MCLNGIILIKLTYVLYATAKWPSHVTHKAATAGNFATTAAGSLSSSNFTSARRHRRLPSSDLKQAGISDLYPSSGRGLQISPSLNLGAWARLV